MMKDKTILEENDLPQTQASSAPSRANADCMYLKLAKIKNSRADEADTET
jgi:hypothetical protein